MPRKAKNKDIRLLFSNCFPRLGPSISTEVLLFINGPKDLLTSETTDSDCSGERNGSLIEINFELSSNCICDLVRLGEGVRLKLLSIFFKLVIL